MNINIDPQCPSTLICLARGRTGQPTQASGYVATRISTNVPLICRLQQLGSLEELAAGAGSCESVKLVCSKKSRCCEHVYCAWKLDPRVR
jgi:hypothetical protein